MGWPKVLYPKSAHTRIRYPNVASGQWVVVRTTVGRRRFCGTGTFALDTLGRFGELRNPRIGHRGSKGGERYGQRRDDRATDPLAPGVRPRDRAGRQRTSVDDRLLRNEGEGGRPQHKPEAPPPQRSAALQGRNRSHILLADHRGRQRPARVK